MSSKLSPPPPILLFYGVTQIVILAHVCFKCRKWQNKNFEAENWGKTKNMSKAI
jgi:hypothetical protein